jgi:hypothetical protein
LEARVPPADAQLEAKRAWQLPHGRLAAGLLASLTVALLVARLASPLTLSRHAACAAAAVLCL